MDPRTRDAGPNPILAGLGAGLLLFTVTLCTLMLFVVPTLSRQLNFAAPPERSWTPPPPDLPAVESLATTQPAADAGAAEETVATPAGMALPAGSAAFAIGDPVANASGVAVNLRRSPGYLNKPTSDRLTLVPAGAFLTITGGPVVLDGLTWWSVRWQDQEGWMAEKRASGGPILAPAR